MKKQEIIYTENYALIVSDEQIKDVRPYKGKFHLEKGYIINQFPTYLTDLSDCKLIIAHRPLKDAPILEGVPLLPKFSEEDDVEKKSRDFVKYVGGSQEQRLAFIDGYLEAKETYKYTEDDLIECILFGMQKGLSVGKIPETDNDWVNNYVKSLQQPKRPKYFECETTHDCCGRYMNCKGCDATADMINIRMKTTNNSKGQTELVGEYSYE